MTRIAQLCLLVTAIGVTLLSTPAVAGKITVRAASSSIVNDIYMVDADLAFEFSEDVLEALSSGIPLVIEVHITVERQQRFWWDADVVAVARGYRIQHHALSERYVLTDLITDDRSVYRSVEALVDGLGQIRGLPIAERAQLGDGFEYHASLRARLDIESLPAPLRPIAWISPAWRMSSKWFRWKLTP